MKAILSFLRDNAYLILFAVGLAFLFLFVGKFAEFIYATIRFFAVIVAAAIVLHWKYPDTLHRYLQDDKLIQDFFALDPKHRCYIAFGTLAVLFLVSALCFVSP